MSSTIEHLTEFVYQTSYLIRNKQLSVTIHETFLIYSRQEVDRYIIGPLPEVLHADLWIIHGTDQTGADLFIIKDNQGYTVSDRLPAEVTYYLLSQN